MGDILDQILEVTKTQRIQILNTGSEFLTKKVQKYYPCLTELLLTLQSLQKKWLTPPTTGDNRWEFQPIFYNPNLNLKKFSRGKKYIIPEDFRFTPDNDILSLRLTDICNEGKLQTDKIKLEKAFGFENWAKPFAVNQLIGCLSKLPTINKIKFPSLPLQKPPSEMHFFEEVSDLFFISKKGGQNYRRALNPEKLGQKIKIDTEKNRFGCDNSDTEIILIFFKFINMHIYAELTKTKKYGNQPTTHNMVSTICGEIIKITQFFKTSKLGYALSKQVVV